MPSRIRNIGIAVLIFAIVGFVDAAYLTWQHYTNSIPPCTLHGCETVLTSSYAQIGPFPVSLFGAAYYLAMIVAGALLIEGATRLRPWMMAGVSVGILFTGYLTILQAFVIHAWCQYCLLSAGTSVVLFILGVMLMRQRVPENSVTPSTPAA